MKTQTRIILSIIVIIFALILIPARTGLASPPEHTLFIPVVRNGQAAAHRAFGFELTNGKIIDMEEEISQFNLDFIRGNLGSLSEPYATPYQLYLSGGWAAADAKVLPNIEGWRTAGAEPLLIFMPGGECTPPSFALLDDFGDFVAAAVERYDLNYFEVWNEPDATSGAPALYGCLGPDHTDKLIYLLDRIRPQLSSGRQMGVSFALGSEEHLEMVEAVAPHMDWVGIHHYGIWGGGQVLESEWPGSLTLKYQLTEDVVEIPVWITELNLRSPGDECGPAHQQAAMDYVDDALELEAPMLSILVYKSYPDWQCTGIRDTLVGDWLLAERASLAP